MFYLNLNPNSNPKPCLPVHIILVNTEKKTKISTVITLAQ